MILLTLVGLLAGLGISAFFTLYFAPQSYTRYIGELAARENADYGFWAIGPLIPPINPEVIEASEADNNLLPDPSQQTPQDDLPIAVVGVSTASPTSEPLPTSTSEPPPPPSPEPTSEPTLAATAVPTATAVPPAPTQTRPPQQAPTNLPVNTRQPTSTPAQPTSTPVTAPEAPPTRVPPAPTNTALPLPTASPTPVLPTAAPPTLTPVPLLPTATPVPPTATPDQEPVLSTSNAAPVVAEDQQRIVVELTLSKPSSKTVTVAYETVSGSARPGFDYQETSGKLVFNPGEQKKTISIGIVRDGLNETPEQFTVALSAPTNAVLDIPGGVLVTILDTNAPPMVRFTGSGRTVGEEDNSVAVTIQLSEVSALDVAVPFLVEGDAENSDHSLRAGTAIIPAGQSSVRLRFAIVDDRIDEDDERIELRLKAPSNAQLGSASLYVITVEDNDTAAIPVVPASMQLLEGGSSGEYGVRLGSQPLFPVQITLVNANGQVRLKPDTLTFNATNWNTEQTVEVTAIDDEIDETPPDKPTAFHSAVVVHTVTSPDPKYNGFAVKNIAIEIADNDSAGVSIDPPSLVLRETQPFTRSYRVRLNTKPLGPVTIVLSPDKELKTNLGNLTFTPENWNVFQAVAVAALDDVIDEDGDGNVSTHQGVVAHTASSSDANYAGVAIARFAASIIDNDTAGVIVSPTNLELTEGGAPGSYTVRLRSQPVEDVTVALFTDLLTGDNQVRIVPQPDGADKPPAPLVESFSLTFKPDNWNVAQTVQVVAQDDRVDEDGDNNRTRHFGEVNHTAASVDPFYDDRTRTFTIPDVVVSIQDNDTVGVIITPSKSPASVDEGELFTYTVVLASQPPRPPYGIARTVSVIPLVDPPGLVTIDATSLVFTSDNWNKPQTVTVTALDNKIDAPDAVVRISHDVSSDDPFYNQFDVADFDLVVANDDEAGVTITPLTLALAEGGSAKTYIAKLTSEPTAEVRLQIAPDNQVSVDSFELIFTPKNWSSGQIVAVTAVDDQVDEDGDGNLSKHDGVIAHATVSDDPNYSGITLPSVSAKIGDNDTAALLITPKRLVLSEDATAPDHSGSVEVRLATQPRADVSVEFTPNTQVAAAPTMLVFTAETWNITQTVTVSAVDDAVDEEDTHDGVVDYGVASGDTAYNNLVAGELLATIKDDDTAALLVEPTAIEVSELPAAPEHSATYTLRLGSQPTAPVTVTLNFDATQLQAEPQTLVFTAANWTTVQTVTVTAVDDAELEGDHSSVITNTITSADANYQALPASAVDVAIADDDNVGLDVSPVSLRLGEGISSTLPISGTVQIQLRSKPTAEVAVQFAADDQFTTDLSALLFTPENWNLPQIVTLTAVDDTIVETAIHTGTLAFALESDDLYYDNRTVQPYTVELEDDDRAELVATLSAFPESVPPGSIVDFTASYTSTGTAVARTTTLTITLAPELTFLGDPCTTAAVPCSATVDTVTLSVGELAAGQGGNYSFVATAHGSTGEQAITLLDGTFIDDVGNVGSASDMALVQIE